MTSEGVSISSRAAFEKKKSDKDHDDSADQSESNCGMYCFRHLLFLFCRIETGSQYVRSEGNSIKKDS